MAMSDDNYKYYNLLKTSDDVIKNVPKICLLPQTSFTDPDSPVSPFIPPVSGYKSSNRDSGHFDSLFPGSKVNFNHQIKTVHNWFKHLAGSDQTRLLAALLPSVHFDYMSMVCSLAQKQAKFIADEVLDYQSLEEEANSLQSLLTLDEEPSVLAVNLLSRLPLLYPCELFLSEMQPQRTHRAAPLAVHQMYTKLLTQVFGQDCVDIEDVVAVRQLATVVAHHPNMMPQMQAKLVELAIERLLLDERSDTKRPRRPMALSPFGPPSQMTQTQSFSLLVPPFLAASCLSASASPQSVCSYNSSGFHSGAESSSRRCHPPLSPQSSTSSCAGDEGPPLPRSVSCGDGGGPAAAGGDYDLVLLALQPQRPPDASAASLHGQSSIDTPTPSSASSVMLVAVSKQQQPSATVATTAAAANSDSLTAVEFAFASYFRDDEADSETNFSVHRGEEETSIDGDGGGRNSFMEPGSGMSNVPSWLKGLRLHKYAGLFQQLGYHEMLNISEEWLESKNVTKGARNKILVNIRKLESRQCALRQAEAEMVSPGGPGPLRACLHEVRCILATPILPFLDDDDDDGGGGGGVAEGDLPGQVVRCLGRACAQLLAGGRKVDEEACGLFLHVADLVIDHESFTGGQKAACQSWWSQVDAHSRPFLRRCAPYRKSPTQRPPLPPARPLSLEQPRPSLARPPPQGQSALLDLFLQCQSAYPPLDRAPWPCCCRGTHPPPPPPDLSVPLAAPPPGSDSSPSGSQDPATAEINRNLDLLAREVTELAIRDPESPDP